MTEKMCIKCNKDNQWFHSEFCFSCMREENERKLTDDILSGEVEETECEDDDLIPEKVDMVAHAWLFGYQIEQEQLYVVEIPNPNENVSVYLYRTTKGFIAINTIYNNPNWKEFPQAKLTETEIKQDFALAWRLAEPVSKEVER